MILQAVRKDLQDSFGFIADTALTIKQNVTNTLRNMNTYTYFNKVNNLAFHNLCVHSKPPACLKATLGLGTKFCVQDSKPKRNVDDTIRRLHKDIQVRLFFANKEDDSNYIPELYIPSKWEPDLPNVDAEKMIDDFEAALLEEKKKLCPRLHFNLTKLQRKTLKLLHQNPKFIIFACDKNLDPAIIERKEYIKRVFQDHLLNETTYKPLDESSSQWRLYFLYDQVQAFFKKFENVLEKAEQTYFQRFMSLKHRVAQFYITAKVQKNPWKSRPIVSTSGSLMSYVSKWVDYKIKDLAKLSPTYIKNSKQVKRELEQINKMPENAIMFCADAVSMYTMIDIEHGIETLSKYLREFHPDMLNIDAVIEGLSLVMRNNIFQFGDCHFEQLEGTAMGTPVACSYATLYYAYQERTTILPKFNNRIKYLKRFIDDALGIIVIEENELEVLEEFKQAWPFGKLTWTFEFADRQQPSVDFLDLTIYQDDSGHLQTKTFEKKLNLHLYIPQHSAHPPGVLQGMIYGNLRRFKNQNSKVSDYIEISKKFFNHLLARGYNREQIKPIFMKAVSKFENEKHHQKPTVINNEKENEERDRIFIHLQYHPRDISRRTIQMLFNKTCMNDKSEFSFKEFKDEEPPFGNGGTLQLKRATIAYSRGPNIRDRVSPSTLFQPAALKASHVMTELTKNYPKV